MGCDEAMTRESSLDTLGPFTLKTTLVMGN